MSVNKELAIAWTLALAPVILFIPAFLLADMGPCSFAHPLVIVIAFLIFACLEIAALRRFVFSARASGKQVNAMFGIALALFVLVLSLTLEFFLTVDYWADTRLGM